MIITIWNIIVIQKYFKTQYIYWLITVTKLKKLKNAVSIQLFVLKIFIDDNKLYQYSVDTLKVSKLFALFSEHSHNFSLGPIPFDYS